MAIIGALETVNHVCRDDQDSLCIVQWATCRYCNQNTGFLRKQHGQCRDLHASGYQEMVQLAAQASSAHTFNEAALRQTLGAIANRSRAT